MDHETEQHFRVGSVTHNTARGEGSCILCQVLHTASPGTGIRSWLELSFGTSWKAYNGMDTYVSMWHHGMEPPPTEAWYLLNSSRLVQFRSRYEPHIFFYEKSSTPSPQPHSTFPRGARAAASHVSAPYCIARHRHPDAAQAWHSAASCQGLQLLNCVSIQDENQMF